MLGQGWGDLLSENGKHQGFNSKLSPKLGCKVQEAVSAKEGNHVCARPRAAAKVMGKQSS